MKKAVGIIGSGIIASSTASILNMDYAERVNAPYWQFCKWNFPEERYIDS